MSGSSGIAHSLNSMYSINSTLSNVGAGQIFSRCSFFPLQARPFIYLILGAVRIPFLSHHWRNPNHFSSQSLNRIHHKNRVLEYRISIPLNIHRPYNAPTQFFSQLLLFLAPPRPAVRLRLGQMQRSRLPTCAFPPSGVAVSSTVLVLPTRVSSIAPSIP